MPNQNTTPHIVKDIDGHIIGCPHCGSRDIRKDGFDYKASKKNKDGIVVDAKEKH